MVTTVQVRALLREQPTLTINEVAAALRCDRHILQRHIRTETGRTFRHLRSVVIMEVAVHLIQSGASLKSVAIDLGYSTERAFARAFERHWGMSPSAYRQSR